jgi:glycosyltransferase involved in cell wall biosynthesis
LTRTKQSWLRWQLREVTLPFERRSVDAFVTPLGRALPLASRLTGGPAVLLLNYGFNTLLRNTSPVRKVVIRSSMRATTRLVCLARSQAEDAIALTGLEPERVPVVRLGIDAEFFAPAPAEAGVDVLSVGKDLARDYATLATAVAPLPIRAHFAAMPRNLAGVAVPDNVDVALFDPWQLRRAYAGAGCVVVAQHGDDYHDGTEGGGLTALLEAMAMARPVVATDRGAIRDYVSDGEEALLVPPHDPSALRAAIERVLGDPVLAERLGAAARRRVERELTTQAMAERLAPVIRGAVER